MKKFFKKTEGFTLVELIVVIAILGVLAGVGTVGYSGYIKKANMAADQQLVGFVNQAFAAACIENGVNYTTITNAEEHWTNKAVDGITSISGPGLTTDKANAVISAFAKYYAGNTGNEFKTVTNLSFYQGVFGLVDPSGKNLNQAQQIALNKFNASNMSGNEIALANSANNLSNLFATEFLDGEADPLGALAGYFPNSADFEQFKDDYNLIPGTSTNTEIANATVLYVASKTGAMTAENVMGIINTSIAENPENGMAAAIGNLTTSYGTLPTYAMMYGVVTGYANSDYASAAFINNYNENAPTGLTDVANLFGQMMVETQNNNYFRDQEKGVRVDMDGYFGAMQLVSDYKDSFNIPDSNAFNNEDSLGLLQTILGNS